MTAPRFAFVPYAHDGPSTVGPTRLRLIYVSLAIAVLTTLLFFPFGAVGLLVPWAARLTAPRLLQIGPRYLLLGKQLFYYGNARQLMLSRAQGTLHLIDDDGRTLLLERSKLQTNARKPDKIARNKAAKFDKVSTLIIERVRLLAPDAVITGESA